MRCCEYVAQKQLMALKVASATSIDLLRKYIIVCVCRLPAVAGRPAALISDGSACIRDDALYKLTIFTFTFYTKIGPTVSTRTSLQE